MQNMTAERLKYLGLLAEQFHSEQELCTEIINLSGVLSLPKGTEHFMSDIHGEYESFCHIMNNCSGVVREKVNLWLGDNMTGMEVSELCTLIYYPRQKLKLLRDEGRLCPAWYQTQMGRLVLLARMFSGKYTRSRVRRAMPEAYARILDELLHAQTDEDDNRHQYHQSILDTLIDIGSGDDFIIVLADLIKHLAVDRLHVVGDIFDRGARSDSVMDILMRHHSIDIEWGNHDILWMGAASGSAACVAGVVRNCLQYRNMEILENSYGIPLRPLALFAEKLYPEMETDQAALEAITVMMFKLEGQLIRRNPDFGMEDRLLLDKLDLNAGTVRIDDTSWPILPRRLPTLQQDDPYALTDEEQQVISGLCDSFRQSLRLRSHISFLYAQGRLYRRYNGNLLFHGCVPMDEDGSFHVKCLEGQRLSGPALMDYADMMARRAFHEGDQKALDFMWYLWCGDDSPLCGRHVTTFARFFVQDKEAWHEPRNPYYVYCNNEKDCLRILAAFGLNETGHIINGHTPIRVIRGESPLKAGGRLIVIDGGFCRAYQKTTGIAGYTLISNSHGMRLMSHQPFSTFEEALNDGRDIRSQSLSFVTYPNRLHIRDTDNGKRLQERVEDLKALLSAVRDGLVNLQK